MAETFPCRLAVVGNPNSGKTALFNRLTGARQKVANYPGATVERRSGRLESKSGQQIEVIDLPGTYSLRGRTADERIALDFLLGQLKDEQIPDMVVCVIDATNLKRHLRFVLEIKALGYPMVVALNMADLAQRAGIEIDIETLAAELGVPVVPTVAVRRQGVESLLETLDQQLFQNATGEAPQTVSVSEIGALPELHNEAKRIADAVILAEGTAFKVTRAVDSILLHPVAGLTILFAVLFLMFQAVYAWAEAPMELIDGMIVGLQSLVRGALPDGFLASFLIDGILAGVGSVIIFLPQIIFLFAFILLLEGSGYMPRAAFLMDRLMASAGLNGRAFIPLLSSFACAIPGIMAARVIENPRDRLTTILIAPLMTCSARLPVYALIIAAFIPNHQVIGVFGLQGLVLFALYAVGIVSALIVAAVLKLTVTQGTSQTFMMELPSYKLPGVSDFFLGLWDKAWIFLRRAGTIIFTTMIILWVLTTFPLPPEGSTEPAITYTVTGIVGKFLAPIFAPIGFSWEMAVSLIPGMAAREVVVAALGTVYALSGSEDVIADSLLGILRASWTLPTALSFLAWYVFSPQCISTLAATKRETNSWFWPAFMFGYLSVMAYVAAFATYRISSALL